MKTTIPVTLIVPTYNRIEKTNNLLKSIADADFSCETIIVDDNSTEDIGQLVEAYSDRLNIKYVKNTENKGPAFSRNVGLRLAKNTYVAFTDNDCIVTKDWLLRLYEYIRDAPSHYAGVGGRTIALHNDIVSQYYEYNKILDPWFYNGKWLYIVSANAIFKKEVAEKVGGFDEKIKRAGGEDVGLCFKIHNIGYDLLYNEDAVIIHDFDHSLTKLCKTFFNYGYGCRIQYEKYYKSTKNTIQNGFGGLPIDN